MTQERMGLGPMKIQTRLVKRREGETEPYEVIETSGWHEADGAEITDPKRIAELEQLNRKDSEPCH